MQKSEPLREEMRVIICSELTGFTKAVQNLNALDLARVLDGYYRQTRALVTAHDGRVVKFIGDGCLAVFGEEGALDAVKCARTLYAMVNTANLPWDTQLSVRMHAAMIAEGTLGGAFDVVGAGVNFAFGMSGKGLTLSEAAYRILPDELQSESIRDKARSTYRLPLFG